MNIKQDVRIHNKFKAIVQDAKTKEIIQEAEAYNVVLDQFWTNFFSTSNQISDLFGGIHLGNGSGTPDKTDTKLFNYITYNNINNSVSEFHDTYMSRTGSIVLSENSNNGIFFSEIGVAAKYSTYSGAESYLLSHAMFTDINGNPITIEKTNTKIITFYATMYFYYGEATTIAPYLDNFLNFFRLTAFVDNCVLVDSDGDRFSTNITVSTREYDSELKKATVGYTRVPLISENKRINKLAIPNVCSISLEQENLVVNELLTRDLENPTKLKTKFQPIAKPTLFVDGVQIFDFTYTPKLVNELAYLMPCIYDMSTTHIYEGNSYGNSSYTTMDAFRPLNDDTIYSIYKNHQNKKILSFTFGTSSYKYPGYMECSNDGHTWIRMFTSVANNTVFVEEEHQQYLYYRYVWDDNNYRTPYDVMSIEIEDYDDGYEMTLTTIPSETAQITASYTTKNVLKDENHVLDLSVTFQFGEYTEGS